MNGNSDVRAIAKWLSEEFGPPCGIDFKSEPGTDLLIEKVPGWCDYEKHCDHEDLCWLVYLEAKGIIHDDKNILNIL